MLHSFTQLSPSDKRFGISFDLTCQFSVHNVRGSFCFFFSSWMSAVLSRWLIQSHSVSVFTCGDICQSYILSVTFINSPRNHFVSIDEFYLGCAIKAVVPTTDQPANHRGFLLSFWGGQHPPPPPSTKCAKDFFACPISVSPVPLSCPLYWFGSGNVR